MKEKERKQNERKLKSRVTVRKERKKETMNRGIECNRKKKKTQKEIKNKYLKSLKLNNVISKKY